MSPTAARVRVAVALGSNLGNREANLRFAADRLGAVLDEVRLSSFHETAPVGVGPQPMFFNAAATGLTSVSARTLLERLLEIEAERGRTRPHVGAPRTLDLDLILFGDVVTDEPGLTVPHPRFRERRFVLAPLAEVGRDLVDPVTGLTVSQLLARLG